VDREEAHGRLRRLQEEVDRSLARAVRQRASQVGFGRIGRPAQRRKIVAPQPGSPERTSRSSLNSGTRAMRCARPFRSRACP